MKRTLIHKPIAITAYEFTGDVKEITDVLESINSDVCCGGKRGKTHWIVFMEG